MKDLEWLVRSAYLVPLHDVRPEKAMVRARMAEIEAEVRGFGDLSAGLDHYALGRGHVALEEWAEARAELERAEAMGVRDPELDYALGRVLGELYSRALEDARRSGDKGYFEKRKLELDRDQLTPALAHLERCRGLRTVSASYLDALVDFYNRRYDDALRNAELARKSLPWLYEAAKLEGDVQMARALDAKDHGDNEEAERRFTEAVQRYEQAAAIGRSDHQVHEALAEAWIRQEEMDMYGGRDPAPKLDRALAAADSALAADPVESLGHTRKAFAYNFEAIYAQNHGAPRDVVERLRRAQIASGEQAATLHPGDAHAQDITGIGYTGLAQYLLDLGQPVEPLLERAFVYLEEAIRLKPRFPWAYNDHGLALGFFGDMRRRQNKDPQEWYQRAIDAIKKACQIDDQYVIAYNNTSAWLNELASWRAEHGEDPEKVAVESVQIADRAIEINRRQPLPWGNAGMALETVASYRLDAGKDGREPALPRRRSPQERARHRPEVRRLPAGARARVHPARREPAGSGPGSSPEPRRGAPGALGVLPRRAGQRRLQGRGGPAPRGAGRLGRQRDQPFLEPLERAQKMAAEAAQKVPDRADLWLVLGEISLQRAEALLATPHPPAPPGPVVDEGLRGLERALEKAPGLPRALAIQGALLLRRAQIEADPARKKATLDRGRESLSQAFSANPLLERRYGEGASPATRGAGGK